MSETIEEFYQDFSKMFNMKKTRQNHPIGLYAVVAAVIALFIAWFCISSHEVLPGYKGVYVDRPYFGKGGVRAESVDPDRYFTWRTTTMIQVPSTPLSQPVKIDDFTTIDNYRVDFDVNVNMTITDPSKIVSDWTLQFWSRSVQPEFISIVRRSIAQHRLQDLMSNQETINQLDKVITDNLRSYIQMRQIPIIIQGVAMGRALPNKIVFDQIEETARKTEEAKTFVEAEKSQAKRALAEETRAKADKAYADKMGMTSEQFVRLRQTELQAEACRKATNCVIGIERIVTTK